MHSLYSDYLHHYAKIKIIVFGFVFCEHINKGLLLWRQLPRLARWLLAPYALCEHCHEADTSLFSRQYAPS